MFDQKESSMLQDLKKAEQICVEKYRKYAADASAPELSSLFEQIGNQEQQHLQTIEQMLNSGAAPASSGSSSQQQTTISQAMQKADYTQTEARKNDSYLCTDALSTEKHVSSDYNTSIFEFKNTAARNTLNHIQKEEQQHGEMIYNYMSANGMYN